MDDKNTAGTKADLTLPLCVLNVCNKEQLIPSCHNVYCGSRKYPYPTNGRDWNFRGVGGQRPRKFLGGGVLYQFILFLPDWFHYSCMLNFLCLHFAYRSADANIDLV